MQSRQYLTTTLVVCLLATLAMPLLAQQPPPAEGDEPALLAVLQSDDATLFDKAKACQRLAVIGTKASVPVLAGLLDDEKMAHYARTGLEANPDPAVDRAFRDALTKLEEPFLVGVIQSIGVRRDLEAVDALQKRLDDSDPAVASAAAWALGRIATPEAIESLVATLKSDSKTLRLASAKACLTAADRLLTEKKPSEAVAIYDAFDGDFPKQIQIAALYGTFRAKGKDAMPLFLECLGSKDKAQFGAALRMARELPEKQVAQAIIDELEKPATSTKQALIIGVLGEIDDPDVLPKMLEYATDGKLHVRLAAVRVLADRADATCVPILLKTAFGNQAELAQAAGDALVTLPGNDVDKALIKSIDTKSLGDLTIPIELIGRRGITSAVPSLFRLARDPQPHHTAAIRALGLTVGLKEMPQLVDLLVTAKTPELAATTKASLEKACQRTPDRDACATILLGRMSKASASVRIDLLDLLGVVGGNKALLGVRQSAESADEALQDAATRVLGGWMSPDAATVLLELAKSGPKKFQVRTLRGYLRIARQLDVPLDERLGMCRKALAISERDAEKTLVFEIAARYPSVESLSIVTPYLKNATLKETAATSAVSIAEKLLNTHPAALIDPMKQVVESTTNAEVSKRARAIGNRARKKSSDE